MNSATHREVGAALSDLVLQTLAQVGHQGPQVRMLQGCLGLGDRENDHQDRSVSLKLNIEQERQWSFGERRHLTRKIIIM